MSFLSFFGLTAAASLEVGAPAPAPAAIDDQGQPLDLAEIYRRGPTLVYFYPKSGTPGCTAQACHLRDSFESLLARGLQIVGVSGDAPAQQQGFREKHRLPFPLIADVDSTVANAFGVPTLLGHPKRQSFLIVGGRIAWRDLTVSPAAHVEKVHAALDALSSPGS